MHRLFPVLVVCFLCSCGGAPDDQPDLAPVKGVVTLDGQPVANANVYFSPKDGGRASSATTDEQGNYELHYIRDLMGAEIGTHQVTISTFREAEITDEGEEEGGQEETIPGKYNGYESAYEQTVEAGDNVLDLALTSD